MRSAAASEAVAAGAAARIAAELAAASHVTPRTIEFRLRDDRSLRTIDQVVSSGKRVLLLEAYRGTAAVLNPIAAARHEGPAEAPWFAEGMSARDEATALSAIRNAVDIQLAGSDFARHEADLVVDVRTTSESHPAPYRPRFSRAQHAAALTRGPLAVAFGAYLASWIADPVGMLVAPPPPAIPVVALIAVLVSQLAATVALATAAVQVKSGRAAIVIALAIVPALLSPLVVVGSPIGGILALIAGFMMVTGAVVAAGAPAEGWLGLGAFGVLGVAGVVSAAFATGVAASFIVAGGMLLGTAAAGILLRRGIRRTLTTAA
jgi:hypothetical protein